MSSLGRFLGPRLRPHRGALLLVLLGLLVQTAFGASVPMGLKLLIDRAILPRDWSLLVQLVAALAAFCVAASLAAIGRSYLYARISSAFINTLRRDMYHHLQALSMDFYGRARAGDVLTRFTSDVAAVENALLDSLPYGLGSLLFLGLSLTLLYVLDWRLAVIATLTLPLSLLGPYLIAGRAGAASRRLKEDEAGVAAAVQEHMGAQLVIRAFGLARHRERQLDTRLQELGRHGLRALFLGAMMERLPALAVWICQVLIVGVGSVYAYRGGLSVGTLVSFNALFLNVSSGLTGIMQLMPALLRAEAGAARVAELLAEPVGVRDRPGASELAPRQTVLEFRDIGFSYGEGRPAVSGLCLHIAERETVAVVGPSGSGKSTLVNLLLRFYDPQQGAVLFDGADLRDVTQESLRRQLALVPQENFLFDTTLRENIRLGRPEASDADVEEAARDAEIHDFIMTLPQGYEAPAGERGGRLSGGQRQRIAIARALLRRPRVLLLDEATSALDATAEAAVNATLRRLSVERTVVSVTHRLASVVHADRIVVMNEGRMVETGTHSELMARQGVYAGLFSKQNAFSVDPSLNRAWIDPRWLRQLAFFADLDDAQLEALASEFTPEEYLAGRSIIEQNAAGERFYILARGTVEVVRDERQVARLQDGDFFGEIALIRDEPRTATVRTVTPCLALSLARGRFLTLFGDSPGFRQAVAARLAKVDLADQSG